MATATQPRLATQFDEQGYVILRNFLTPQALASAQAAINTLVDRFADQQIAAGKRSDRLASEPFETRLLRLYESNMNEAPVLLRSELHLAGLYDLFFNAQLLDIVEELLGGEIRLYPNYSIR